MANRTVVERLGKLEADTQYAVGAFDALAELLAVMARHQGLDILKDVNGLFERDAILHKEHEKHRSNGFVNVLSVFNDVYSRGSGIKRSH